MRFFNLDGPFHKFGTLIFDIMMLGLFWFFLSFFSFGLLLGPATAALYYSVHHGLVQENGYVGKLFWSAFLKKFVKSFLLGIGLMIITGAAVFNLYAVLTGLFSASYLIPVYMFIFIEISLISTTLYPLIVFTDFGMKDLVTTSFLLANRHLPRTFLSMLILGVMPLMGLLLFFGYPQFAIILLFIMPVLLSGVSKVYIGPTLSEYDFFRSYREDELRDAKKHEEKQKHKEQS